MEIQLRGFQCLRCGHQWRPRKQGMPLKCPACDSPGWRLPRGETTPPYLEEVFRLYEVPKDQRAEIVRYAAQHPGVAKALLEAVPDMEKVFGKARRRLDLFQFEDGGGDEMLYGLILVKDDPDQVERYLDLERQFSQAIFPRIPREVHHHLNFTIDFEDAYPV